HPDVVDVAHLDRRYFRDAHPGRVGRRSAPLGTSGWARLRKTAPLRQVQHVWQRCWLARVRNALGNLVLAEHYAVKKTQSANDLVQRCPSDALTRQMRTW
ncbi:MAG: hypothetical protein WA791_21205, partial [Rhodomicrobium sp.]